MVNSPTWASVNTQIGWPAPGNVDTGKLRTDADYDPSVPIGTIAQFQDVGTTRLGTGTFIFLPGVTSTVAGDVVTYETGVGAAVNGDTNNGAATVRWTGTANTGAPLAVATAATNTGRKWGWYQVQGAAIINVSGTVAASDTAVYFGQTAKLQTNAAVGGKQVIGAQPSSASGVPDTGQAIFTINNPVVQSQIT